MRDLIFFESEEQPHVKEVNEGSAPAGRHSGDFGASGREGRREVLIHDVQHRAGGANSNDNENIVRTHRPKVKTGPALLEVLRTICIIRIIWFSVTEDAMAQTTAVEFQRKLGEFQHRAQREPVEITRHGRRELVLMSADHYDWLVAAARRSHRTADAAPVVADAVRRAEMDPEQRGLDDLLT
jgi:prevent-host-death family protein